MRNPLASPHGSRRAGAVLAGLLSAAVIGAVAVSRLPIALERGTPPPHRAAAPAAADSPLGIPDGDARRLLDDLAVDSSRAEEAIRRILQAHDTRFIAPLLEVLRAAQIGILNTVDAGRAAQALEALSGQRLGDDWPAWVEWYGTTSLLPPPGFTGWKGRLLSRIDPRFAELLPDAAPSRIRVEEIEWGGVGVDGIPALTHPAMLPAAAAAYLTPQEPVFGLAVNGEARAYPLRILDWHEMVNDVVGGVPISLAYCTLCGAGIAYEGRASDGATYTFGSSGLLFRSNKLMYDHQTRTLWNQLTGEPVLGRLAGTGVTLTLRPVVLTTWQAWRAEHPTTLVLDIQTGYDRVYLPGVPYGRYFASPDTMFPVWRRNRALPPKARIFALRLDGVPKAYPLEALLTRRVVNDAIGSTPVVLIATHGKVTVTGRHEAGVADRVRAGNVAYEAGAEVRAYRRGEEHFAPGPDAGSVKDSSGRIWRVTEDALVGPDGRRAGRIPGFLAYWFGWYAFFPHTLVYSP